MKFAQRVFLLAGLYGLVVLVPLFFLEDFLGREDPPPITHPEFFYGFVGVAVAWQVLFLLLARDPARYRPLIIPAILEKISYGIAVVVLALQGRVAAGPVAGGVVDLFLAVLFALAYVALGRPPKAA